eukprot:CAMPEP_0178416200 /NCGR_PEP_ID=MMETSP0689_2-20121128/23942_1 /TAXON_ID=160604 /ORGANISM="Amphidinium massartii, Strain CS-259" /LENGTH=526 /DNA_ID=CAMNT_0020037539 /DNA_START=59 /DNA_END=1635 /DNA_ORIENTATION=+
MRLPRGDDDAWLQLGLCRPNGEGQKSAAAEMSGVAMKLFTGGGSRRRALLNFDAFLSTSSPTESSGSKATGGSTAPVESARHMASSFHRRHHHRHHRHHHHLSKLRSSESAFSGGEGNGAPGTGHNAERGREHQNPQANADHPDLRRNPASAEGGQPQDVDASAAHDMRAGQQQQPPHTPGAQPEAPHAQQPPPHQQPASPPLQGEHPQQLLPQQQVGQAAPGTAPSPEAEEGAVPSKEAQQHEEELRSREPPLPEFERHPTKEMLDEPPPGTEAALQLHAAEKDRRHVAEMKRQELINQQELQKKANEGAKQEQQAAEVLQKRPSVLATADAARTLDESASDAMKRFNDIRSFMDATKVDRKKLDAVMLENMQLLRPLCQQYTKQRAELLTLAAPQCEAAQGRVNALDWSSGFVRGRIGKHCVPDKPPGPTMDEDAAPPLKLTPSQCDFKSHKLLCQERLSNLRSGAPSPTYVASKPPAKDDDTNTKDSTDHDDEVPSVPVSMDAEVRHWCHPVYNLGPGSITMS